MSQACAGASLQTAKQQFCSGLWSQNEEEDTHNQGNGPLESRLLD